MRGLSNRQAEANVETKLTLEHGWTEYRKEGSGIRESFTGHAAFTVRKASVPTPALSFTGRQDKFHPKFTFIAECT